MKPTISSHNEHNPLVSQETFQNQVLTKVPHPSPSKLVQNF